MLNVEKLRIVAGFTEATAFDLYYMPYTPRPHRRAGPGGGVRRGDDAVLQGRRAAAGALVAGAVFSHWLLDLVVHVEDLPLLGDAYKVGFACGGMCG